MNWSYELVEHAIDQYRELDADERKGLREELIKVVEDHQLGRVPRQGKTEKLKGQKNRFRLKSWPRRAIFYIEKRPALDEKGKPLMNGKNPVMEGFIVVYEIERRDKVYKAKK